MTKKTIAMIPVRLGSKRIPMKNIRLINGKLLVCYIIEAAIQSKIFDEIWLNSEADIFSEIASKYDIKFYKRDDFLSSDSATNDDFVYDFISNNSCDTIIQLLATSPFITHVDIQNFVSEMHKKECETFISVKNNKIECVFEKKPINFISTEQTLPSQMIEPVQSYACSMMGWDIKRYKENIKKYNAAYHGGDGTVGFFELKGFSTVDIDNEEDFVLAEFIAKSLNNKLKIEPSYYKSHNDSVETDVPSILVKDGVMKNDLFDSNKEVVNISDVIKHMGTPSWSKRLVDTDSNSATLICQSEGEGNRRHYHSDWNEWWYIVQGEWEWEIEGVKRLVKTGDVVLIEKGKKHKITAVGKTPSIRLAVSRSDVGHIYENN